MSALDDKVMNIICISAMIEFNEQPFTLKQLQDKMKQRDNVKISSGTLRNKLANWSGRINKFNGMNCITKCRSKKINKDGAYLTYTVTEEQAVYLSNLGKMKHDKKDDRVCFKSWGPCCLKGIPGHTEKIKMREVSE